MAERWKLPGAYRPDEAGSVFRSDTGELVLDAKRRLFTAVAPNVVMAAGYCGSAGEVTLGKVTIACKTPFAAITLLSLDGKPLEESTRLLLTAVARAENTGEVITFIAPQGKSGGSAVDADTGGVLRSGGYALSNPGAPPVLAEPVDAQVRLATSARLQAFPLGPRAERRAALGVDQREGTVTVKTGDAHSPWILLSQAN
jgi:hypothetical protein